MRNRYGDLDALFGNMRAIAARKGGDRWKWPIIVAEKCPECLFLLIGLRQHYGDCFEVCFLESECFFASKIKIGGGPDGRSFVILRASRIDPFLGELFLKFALVNLRMNLLGVIAPVGEDWIPATEEPDLLGRIGELAVGPRSEVYSSPVRRESATGLVRALLGDRLQEEVERFLLAAEETGNLFPESSIGTSLRGELRRASYHNHTYHSIFNRFRRPASVHA